MMTPIVTQLDDDDCDGKITANDIPDIVFTSFSGGAYRNAGSVHSVSVKNGKLTENWVRHDLFTASRQIASANIDGVAGNEIVGCGPTATIALRADGSTLWSTSVLCTAPAIADLDGDGEVEVVVDSAVLDGKTGRVKASFSPKGAPTVADLDGDGKLDILAGGAAFHADGTLLANPGRVANHTAVADFDKDGVPEVVAVDSASRQLWMWRYDATATGHAVVLRADVDLNAGIDPKRCVPARVSGGGPPTVGDFNGDGVPDVALAGAVGYAVFDGKKLMDRKTTNAATVLWARPTQDCSSAATGSSLFDFDGDGKAEVVYGDETTFHVYNGATGKVLFETCNTTGTISEYPVIADIDNDGHADIVVASNAYAAADEPKVKACAGGQSTSGIRVFSSADRNWVRTRRIWNQHAYSVTNIEEDGTVPRQPKANWLVPELNNFRQNKQPGQELSATDAVVHLNEACDSSSSIQALVQNVGEAVLPAGAVVDIVAGGKTVTSTHTSLALYPAQSQTLSIGVTTAGLVGDVYAVVHVPSGVEECRSDNNKSPPLVRCSGPR
jgi:hypothetical protein